MRRACLLLVLFAFGCKDAPADDSEAPLPDEDGDGFDTSEDCDDTDPTINPDANELCDGIDWNCDGVADLGAVDAFTYYLDSDNDGYGDVNAPQQACTQPDHFVAVSTDCDDGNNLVYPGAREVCDDEDTDEDCDGLIDDADNTVDTATMNVFYADADADGYGEGEPTMACDGGANLAESLGDCDEGDAAVHPGATESCGNGLDDDCDGTANACNPNGSLSLGLYDHLTGGAGDLLGSALAGGVDLSGDGLDDWAAGATQITASGPGYVKVVGADVSAPSATLTGPSGSEAGASLGVTGVGGVGYLAIGAPGSSGDDGAVFLLSGSLSSRTLSGATLTGSGQEGLGSSVLPVDFLATGTVNTCGYASASMTLYCDGLSDLPYTSSQLTLAELEIDGDGQPELAVGEPGANAGQVILASAGGVGVTVVGDNDGDEFGGSIAKGRDADGDGHDDLLVGAPGRSNTAGGAYFYGGLPTSGYVYTRTADATFGGADSGDRVGRAVALVDIDGDQLADLVLGAPGTDDAESDQGAVYVFYSPVSGNLLVEDADAVLWGESTFAAAGSTLARAGDVDGDGYDDLAVGAPGDSAGGSLAGAAYLVFGGSL